MADFDVFGKISASAKDAISEFKEVAGSLRDAASAADEAGDEAEGAVDDITALASAAESLDFAVDQAEEEFDDLNDEIQEGLANLKAMEAQMIETSGSARILDSSLEGIEGDQIAESDTFRQALMDVFEDEGVDRSAVGGALGNFMQSDEDETLSDLARRIRGRSDVDVDTQTSVQGVAQAASELAGLKVAADSAEESVEELDDEMEGTTASALGLSGALLQASSATEILALAMSQSEENVEDLEDDLNDLNKSLQGLAPALSNVSANIGPFNVALRNVLVTIPAMLMVLGPLMATMFGLATAAGAATAALGAFAGIGAFAFAKQLEQQFASVKNTTEAFTAIVKGLGLALKDALQPLFNVEFAGMSAIEFFIRVIQDLVLFVHLVAEAFAELLQMEEVEQFFLRIEAALLGMGEATSGISMLAALKETIEVLLPPITDLIVFLLDELPNTLSTFASLADKILPSLKRLAGAFIEFAVALSELGSETLPVIFASLAVFLGVIADIIRVVANLMEALSGLNDTILALVIGLGIVVVLSLKLITTLGTLITVLEALSAAGVITEAVFTSMTASIGAFAVTVLTVIGAIFLIAAGLFILEKRFNTVSDTLNALTGLYEALIEPVIEVAMGLYETAEAAGAVSPLIEIVVDALAAYVGIALVAVGVTALFSKALAVTLAKAFVSLAAIAVRSIYAITAALVSSGWGVLLIAIGVALYLLIFRFEAVKEAAINTFNAITDPIQGFLEWLGLSESSAESLANVLVSAFSPALALFHLMEEFPNPFKSLANWIDNVIKRIKELKNLLRGNNGPGDGVVRATGAPPGMQSPSPMTMGGGNTTNNVSSQYNIAVYNTGDGSSERERYQTGRIVRNKMDERNSRTNGT